MLICSCLVLWLVLLRFVGRFVNFYPAARRLIDSGARCNGLAPMEGVVREGELIFVPRGWVRPPPRPRVQGSVQSRIRIPQ